MSPGRKPRVKWEFDPSRVSGDTVLTHTLLPRRKGRKIDGALAPAAVCSDLIRISLGSVLGFEASGGVDATATAELELGAT